MRVVYLLFTAAMLLASLLCFSHARHDRDRLALYLTLLVYGLVLEKLVVVGFDAYTYPAPAYVFDVLGIPLAVAFGWSAVLYAGLVAADALGVPRAGRPGFVGLYALHVDLSMDAIAVRVPFWEWTSGGVWFGVPLGNFFGWFCVAVLFTAWYDALRPRVDGRLALHAGTLLGATGSLLVALQAWVSYVNQPGVKVAVLGLCGLLALAILVVRRPTFAARPPAEMLAAVLVFHVFFLALLLASGFYRETPALLVVSLGMLAFGLAVHRLPAAVVARGR